MSERKYYWWHEMTAPEVIDFAKNVSDIAILPIGAIEQHGPHAPIGVDAFNAKGIAEMVAKKTDVMLIPWMFYGSHPYHHHKMPGTIPLGYDTHIAMLVDIIKGAAVTGFNKFLIVSAHGQVSTTIVAVHKLGLAGYFTLSLHWYDFLRDDKDALIDYMWHAEEAETSMGLYLYPEYIDMCKAAAGGGTPLVDKKFIIAPGQTPKPGMMYHFEGTFARPEYKELDNGIIGDARNATYEKGKKITDRTVDHIVAVIEDIKAKWPIGMKPPVD